MSEQSQADVLAAMLRIAEGDIKAKDEQHALLQQIIATNEKEIAAKDGRILELEEEVRALKREMEEFKSLFDMYLNRQEAARAALRRSRSVCGDTYGVSGGKRSGQR